MKFVMTKAEVAAALALSEAEFDTALPHLQGLDFPKPITGLGERWSIMDVITWVNREHGKPVSYVTSGLSEGVRFRH